MERLSGTASVSGTANPTVVGALLDEARGHRALHHPYLAELAGGTYPDPLGAVVDLGRQELSYNRHFGRCLAVAIDQLESPRHRALLLGALFRDRGQLTDLDAQALQASGIERHWVEGVSRTHLLRRFLGAVGMDAPSLETHPAVAAARLWSHEMLSLCGGGGAARVLGGLGLGELALSATLYRPILAAVAAHTPTTPRDRVFFALRAGPDAALADDLCGVAAEVATTPRAHTALRAAMLRALSLRASFFDTMRHRALSMAPPQPQ